MFSRKCQGLGINKYQKGMDVGRRLNFHIYATEPFFLMNFNETPEIKLTTFSPGRHLKKAKTIICILNKLQK